MIESVMSPPVIILGSRSPRRRELLASITGTQRLVICPPTTEDELGFDGVHCDSLIEHRLREIVMQKFHDVYSQISSDQLTERLKQISLQSVGPPVIVVADTIVIANRPDGDRVVLGQPRATDWQADVRHWFSTLLSGTSHSVWTCFGVSSTDFPQLQIVRSLVTFVTLTESMIDWYLSTNESCGKAGGYGIQGHAAAFVCGLQGSLTNVIGLPLMEVLQALRQAGVVDE